MNVTGMDDNQWLAQRFEEHRARLTAVAQRMLGSPSEAEDAVQEAWLRLNRSDADSIENLGAWLTTVLSRVCLNMLQARRSRPEVPLEAGTAGAAADGADPEHEALLADSVGLALLVVLDTLSPPERVALVLHDMFGVSFEEIGPIVGRNEIAARQLASRARRRVRGEEPDLEGPDRLRRAELVDAFLAAARSGEFERLLAVLDPDVVLRADAAAVALGVAPELHGAPDVARFCRRASGARAVLLDGDPAAVWMPGGEARVVYGFETAGGRITAIDLIADPARLRVLGLAP
jgi:RNA polymerase sigma factor (sigma-70 family)